MKTIKTTTETESSFGQIVHAGRLYVVKNFKVIGVFFLTFLISLLIAFLTVSSSETVYSSALSEFELGQISDKTIVADVSLPADGDYPIEVIAGEKIIRKGFPVTEIALAKLNKMAVAPTYIDYKTFSYKVLYMMLLTALAVFLFNISLADVHVSLKEAILLGILFIIVYGATSFGGLFLSNDRAYTLPIIIPATFCVIIVAVLFGQAHGVFFSFILSFGVLNAQTENIVPFLFVLASCLAATRIVKKVDRRLDLVFVSLLLAVLNVVFMLVLKIIFDGNVNNIIFPLLMVSLNGFLSGILALGFLTPLESLLNTASVFRLMDLSDLNSATMKKMLVAAPGTYNHSMMVATLAENACSAIHANALLARVGAYYHDVGKIEQSEYFVENQTGENKHNELNPRLSTTIIKSHVKKGVEKATEMRLPKEVVDIIGEHHGNGLISFFYDKAKNLDENVSKEEFSYPGTPPSSKESAVVMLADTVEAACRTLKNPSPSRLKKFIHELVMGKFTSHQLDNSELSFKDLSVIEDSFLQILVGYYHTRIEYPNQKDPDADEKTEKDSGQQEVRIEQ